MPIFLTYVWKFIGCQHANLKSSYAELSEKIERMSKLLYFIQTKISVPANMLPPLLMTVVNYYILDMHDESFLLPFPSMYDPNFEKSLDSSFKFTFYSRICWSLQTPIQTVTTSGVSDMLAIWRHIDILCGSFARSNFVSIGWNLLADDCLRKSHFRWRIEMVSVSCIPSISMGIEGSILLCGAIVCGSETVEYEDSANVIRNSDFRQNFLPSPESRLFGDINAIFEFHFTSLFLATLFNVCSTLLVLQMQLVKYWVYLSWSCIHSQKFIIHSLWK